MANQKYFLRITAIIQRINQGDYPSRKDILRYLEEKGYIIQTRAFERDKKTAFDMFGIKIQYNAQAKGYYIESEFDNDFASAKTRELINLFSSIKLAGNNSDIISFENRKIEGTELMVAIIDAINRRRVLAFKYQKYFENHSTERLVEPYMLKESLGRWYLIAKDRKDKQIKNFGLDRIGVIYPTSDLFSKPKNLNIEALYKNAFGVTNVDNLYNITIDVKGVDAKYIASYPLHHSQKIISENNDVIRFSLELSIAKDFIMELMKYIPNVEVIKPQVLREELYNRCLLGIDGNKL